MCLLHIVYMQKNLHGGVQRFFLPSRRNGENAALVKKKKINKNNFLSLDPANLNDFK